MAFLSNATLVATYVKIGQFYLLKGSFGNDVMHIWQSQAPFFLFQALMGPFLYEVTQIWLKIDPFPPWNGHITYNFIHSVTKVLNPLPLLAWRHLWMPLWLEPNALLSQKTYPFLLLHDVIYEWPIRRGKCIYSKN